MAIEVVNQHLESEHEFRGNAWLVKDLDSGQHFVVSGVHAFGSGWEVLVFPAESDGTVTDWMEVTGGRGISHEEAISDLEEYLSRKSKRDDFEDNEIKLFLVGVTSEDAQSRKLLFDDYSAAVEYAFDNGSNVYSVTANIDWATIAEES